MRNYIRLCGLVLALVLCVTAVFVGAEEPDTTEETATVFAKDRVTRILLLGCDRASGLADSILVVSINESDKQVSILQIPRDTYAEYTEKSYKKLNGALSALGESGIKELLGEALGVTIHHFAIVKLDLFCNSNTVICYKRCTVFFVKNYISALGAECYFNCISKLVNA